MPFFVFVVLFAAATSSVARNGVATAAGKLFRVQHCARVAADRSRLRRVRRQRLRHQGDVSDG